MRSRLDQSIAYKTQCKIGDQESLFFGINSTYRRICQGEAYKRNKNLRSCPTTPNVRERQIACGGGVTWKNRWNQKRVISRGYRESTIPRKLPNLFIFLKGKLFSRPRGILQQHVPHGLRCKLLGHNLWRGELDLMVFLEILSIFFWFLDIFQNYEQTSE